MSERDQSLVRTISWNGEGDVTFNGREIQDNLLKR